MRTVMLLAALFGCGRFGFELQPLGVDGALDGEPDAAAAGWTHLIAADETTCGVYLDRAYCWGRGTNGEIGDGAGLDRASPTAVALPPGTVTALAQGEGHGCAILDATLYCWGNAPPGTGAPSSALPVQVTALPSPVVSVGCGGGFTCAVAAGNVYCWGADNAGALGNGPSTATLMTPAQVVLPATAVSIDAGNDHAITLLADGRVFAWGHNDGGALGTGLQSPTMSELPVQSLVTNVQPRIAGWHACAVLDTGAATCWGTGTRGELGDGLATNNATPVAVTGMSAGVSTIMTGGGPTDDDASCAVMGGETWCWGSGTNGRLGTGGIGDEMVPVHVAALPAGTVELALGYNHSCARSAAGTVRCWGLGVRGQLGDGTSTSSLAPVLVPPP